MKLIAKRLLLIVSLSVMALLNGSLQAMPSSLPYAMAPAYMSVQPPPPGYNRPANPMPIRHLGRYRSAYPMPLSPVAYRGQAYPRPPRPMAYNRPVYPMPSSVPGVSPVWQPTSGYGYQPRPVKRFIPSQSPRYRQPVWPIPVRYRPAPPRGQYAQYPGWPAFNPPGAFRPVPGYVPFNRSAWPSFGPSQFRPASGYGPSLPITGYQMQRPWAPAPSYVQRPRWQQARPYNLPPPGYQQPWARPVPSSALGRGVGYPPKVNRYLPSRITDGPKPVHYMGYQFRPFPGSATPMRSGNPTFSRIQPLQGQGRRYSFRPEVRFQPRHSNYGDIPPQHNWERSPSKISPNLQARQLAWQEYGALNP